MPNQMQPKEASQIHLEANQLLIIMTQERRRMEKETELQEAVLELAVLEVMDLPWLEYE